MVWLVTVLLFIPKSILQAAPIVNSVTPPSKSVPQYGIVQWSMTITNVTTNPWEVVDISLDLTPPKGGKPYYAKIKGYHQGTNEWRVRAALQNVGNYPYKLNVNWNGASLHTSSGTVTCDASAPPQKKSVGPKGFLRPRFDSPPYRTAFDDGTLFSGFGLGDCLNEQLTFATYDEKTGQVFNRTLEQYVSDYGNAGFNIFRWSNGNCAWNIYDSFDAYPNSTKGNKYNETLCALLDHLFDTFRSHGYSMWAVPFSKDNSRYPVFPHAGESNTTWHFAQRAAIGRYLDFVVSRWGAQVDIWSLLNEQRAEDNWLAFAAEYLRSIDPYKHPITSSWNDHLNMSQMELDSVHWYYSTGVQNSDIAMVTQARTELANKKPVYFTESGNNRHNWDPQSHIRMRIRSWTAFFEACVLMWWNTAGTQNCTPCGGGNMYLGPTERSYQKTLREFVAPMTDPTLQAMNISASNGVRAYGLVGAGNSGKGKLYMAYANHYASHDLSITANLTFPIVLAGCTGVWVHPETGATTPAVASGVNFTSPPFKIDIALSISCAH